MYVSGGLDLRPSTTGYNVFHLAISYYSTGNLPNRFDIDLWPDDLPQINPVAVGGRRVGLEWSAWTNESSSYASCCLRIFDDIWDYPDDAISFVFRASRVLDDTGRTWQNLYGYY